MLAARQRRRARARARGEHLVLQAGLQDGPSLLLAVLGQKGEALRGGAGSGEGGAHSDQQDTYVYMYTCTSVQVANNTCVSYTCIGTRVLLHVYVLASVPGVSG